MRSARITVEADKMGGVPCIRGLTGRLRSLLDEGLSPRVAGVLIAAGHDAVHGREIGLMSAPDETVVQAALDDDRALVTIDTYFGRPAGSIR
jgi:predicted nuclease of predicted toxin-antitoxin system